ncbi:hypothetical protein C6P40_005021 [Pichia californica]|uniref:Uncharacterized protein n=1 Tax=Pichia californica TaxID=460514 RepID=A0A9P6WR75_9ASCO|nr:hypothetical protein C6P40_005021 [[Candida] californica]
MGKMDLFIKRLKQRVPINSLNFASLELPLDDASQDEILKVLVTISETNVYYSMTILKKLIDMFEKDGEMDINDGFYEYLMEWLQAQPLKPTDVDIINYTFDNDIEIKIRESPNLISGLGTTGMRTWEASLYLSAYLMDIKNKILDQNGNILELGCGTGIVSISLMMKLMDIKPQRNVRVYITDGDSQLVERVKDNIELNINAEELERSLISYDIRKLWWGEDNIPDDVKTILAADVTYDSSIIPDLIQVINEGMSEGNVSFAFVAATKRNEETLAVWEKWLDMGTQDNIWAWDIVSSRRGEQGVDSSSIFYGAFPNDIFLYRLVKVVE